MANATGTTDSKEGKDDPKAFYGYLFNPDKGPTEIMRELLTAIGRYIVSLNHTLGAPSCLAR